MERPQQNTPHFFLRPITLLLLLLIMTGGSTGCNPSKPTPIPGPTPDKSFIYQIRVFNGVTQQEVQDVQVTLELLQGSATKIRFTDSTGHARFFIDSELVDKPAFLIVEKDNYRRFTLNIDLKRDQLPGQVPLIPADSAITVFPTETATTVPTIPTPTEMPAPTTSPLAKTKAPPTPTLPPEPTAIETPGISVATAVKSSTIYAGPDSNTEQLTYLNPGDKVYVIARTFNKSWFYVLDIRGNYGYVAANRFDWPGEMDILPVITPEPVSPSSSTSNTDDAFSTLAIDFWTLPDGRCTDGQWYRNVYIQGRGGDQAYTYYYFNDTDRELQYLASRTNQGYTFEVAGEGNQALRLTGEVRSGDGQSIRSSIIRIEPYSCP